MPKEAVDAHKRAIDAEYSSWCRKQVIDAETKPSNMLRAAAEVAENESEKPMSKKPKNEP